MYAHVHTGWSHSPWKCVTTPSQHCTTEGSSLALVFTSGTVCDAESRNKSGIQVKESGSDSGVRRGKGAEKGRKKNSVEERDPIFKNDNRDNLVNRGGIEIHYMQDEYLMNDKNIAEAKICDDDPTDATHASERSVRPCVRPSTQKNSSIRSESLGRKEGRAESLKLEKIDKIDKSGMTVVIDTTPVGVTKKRKITKK